MRIAHVSLSVEYYPGVARQRVDEAAVAHALTEHEWDVYVVSQHWEYGRGGVNLIMPDVPRTLLGTFPGRGGRISLSGRALTLNLGPARGALSLAVERLTEEYDVVIVRYYPGEILSRPIRRKDNVIFLHHTMAMKELALQSRIGAFVERITGPRRQAGALAVAGVTPEIAKTEAARAGGLPWLALPNGIQVDRVSSKSQHIERGGPLRLVMVAGHFRPWHGLDVVLRKMAAYSGTQQFELHLAGAMEPRLREAAMGHSRVAWHGVLGRNELDRLLSTADVCFGSMAMHRTGLSEGSSIKVRDALARGIPVLSGCADKAFPEGFEWYRQLPEGWQWADALNFAARARKETRADVAASAREYIDYEPIMLRFIEAVRPLL